jgi:hypothetical protein
MQLLVEYMIRAMDRGIVDTWDIWQYPRTPEDAAWIRTLEHVRPGVRVLVPTRTETYVDVYEYYRDHTTPNPDDVFLKLDDDIVFIDLDGLEKFVDFRRIAPKYYIVSANVVNNVMCARVHKGLGMFPGLELDDLHASAEKATELHRRVVVNGESPAFDSVIEYNTEYPLNINCIAWLGADVESVAMCESTTVGRDEQNLSSNFPRIFQRPCAIFGPCVVSHLSFYTQDAGMDVESIIQQYMKYLQVGVCSVLPSLYDA